MNGYQIFFATASLIMTIAGSITAYLAWRTKQLRREEVQKWADDCITCLQTLFIISFLEDKAFTEAERDKARLKIVFDSAILVERGRIFFKNEIIDDFGKEKFPAYRGYRPRILDHIVIAHQIARFWPDDNKEQRQRRSAVAEDCLKQFVSLARQEVGREKAASTEALKGGDGVNLEILMKAIDVGRLENTLIT